MGCVKIVVEETEGTNESKMEIKVCCPVLCTHQTQIMVGSLCRNDLRHWRELMTEKAGLRGLCSSGAPFHHQFVSPGKCCVFLCASVMISCTWLSLHSPVLTGTLSAAFLNQIFLAQFPYALWIFWVTHPSPRGPWTCCSITGWISHGYESPSCLSHIDLLLLTAYKSEISCLLSVSMCVFSHPAA